MNAERVRMYGLEIDPLTMDAAVERCRAAMETREDLMVGMVNAAKIVNMSRDTHLRESLLTCRLVLADGQSVVWASRLLGLPLPTRVTGIDLFEKLLAVGEAEGRSVYLLGARPEVLELLRSRLRISYPALRIAGSRDGYFGEDEAAAVAADIRSSGADMLFLGMTSPLKEIFLKNWGPTLGVPVQHGVGGSFDVLAGITKRAPRAWQRMGMEWAYRLLQEPRRLWRRYLTTNTAFVVMTFREMVRPRRPFAPPATRADFPGRDLATGGDSTAA